MVGGFTAGMESKPRLYLPFWALLSSVQYKGWVALGKYSAGIRDLRPGRIDSGVYQDSWREVPK